VATIIAVKMVDLYNYFDKVYYINLDEDDNKKKYFQTEIAKSRFLSEKAKRYSAVIGKYIDIRLISDSIITERARTEIMSKNQKIFGISLTYGSLGCAMSHYLIYQECKGRHKPFLILEDDIIISTDFDNQLLVFLNEIESNKLEYDIIYLGFNEIPGFNKKILNNVVSKPTGFITGTYGMIVSNKGADKILKEVFPLNQQIDSSISHNLEKFDVLCPTQKIVKVNLGFGSKTQSKTSCINQYNYEAIEDSWMKLFQ